VLLTWREIRARKYGRVRGSDWLSVMSLPFGRRQPLDDFQIQARPTPIVSLPDNSATACAVAARAIGRITWFVFGSRGDVVPIVALARRLREYGIDIEVVRPHTEAEGLQILAAVEGGSLFSAAGWFFKLVSMTLAGASHTFGPPEAWGVDVAFSLRPPMSVAHPADFGAGWLMNFIINDIVRAAAPLLRIGAYPGVSWLPRSADGNHFLPSPPPTGARTVPVLVAWGSSTIPRPAVVGVPDVVPGDHFAQFATARVVLTHGGAGTVQTAAAAGARVVVGTSVLDRRYRTPTNAGLGVMAGASPDKILISLLPLHPIAWALLYRHSWTLLFDGVRVWVGWYLPGLLWSVALVGATVFERGVTGWWIGPSFTATLFGNIFLAGWPTIAKWAVAPRVYEIFMYIVSILGQTPVELLFSLLHFTVNATQSWLWWIVYGTTGSLVWASFVFLGGAIACPNSGTWPTICGCIFYRKC